MFERAFLLGPTERSIALATRLGNAIPNIVELEPDQWSLRKYEALLRKQAGRWKARKPACGVYNCGGHVWASRRTAILEEEAWRLIFRDDGYRVLGPNEGVALDDLAVYLDGRSAGAGGFLHVGRVIELRSINRSPAIPWVLSKWDSTSGEVVHHFRHVPWSEDEGFGLRVEFWSDRPVPQAE